MSLVQQQTGLKNRIHAVFHRQGVVNEHADLFGTAGRRTLKRLFESKDSRIPESGRATLRGCLQLLDQLRRQLAGVSANG